MKSEIDKNRRDMIQLMRHRCSQRRAVVSLTFDRREVLFPILIEKGGERFVEKDSSDSVLHGFLALHILHKSEMTVPSHR